MDDPLYTKMIEDIRDGTLRAGKIFGCANFGFAKGKSVSDDALFFQNGPAHDGYQPKNVLTPRASSQPKGYAGGSGGTSSGSD
jgi:hypothetical protein